VPTDMARHCKSQKLDCMPTTKVQAFGRAVNRGIHIFCG
jgi:hypothetical protein